jgi:hypothetical protein
MSLNATATVSRWKWAFTRNRWSGSMMLVEKSISLVFSNLSNFSCPTRERTASLASSLLTTGKSISVIARFGPDRLGQNASYLHHCQSLLLSGSAGLKNNLLFS